MYDKKQETNLRITALFSTPEMNQLIREGIELNNEPDLLDLLAEAFVRINQVKRNNQTIISTLDKSIGGDMEIWKTIEGYPNYQVSNTGKVRSLNYYGHGKVKELKPQVNPVSKLFIVRLYNEAGFNQLYVHHLVGKAFLKSVEGKDCVIHISNDVQDNRVNNLKWCTKREVNFKRKRTQPNDHNYLIK